ncbi:MAG TPA: class I SAM-dependent methyltransferase [Nitrososphaerales archaeon]|nr:class I SAM-dependent methyltransferase [Nitrososphaerales archaeon]
MAIDSAAKLGDRRIPRLFMENPIRRLFQPHQKLVSKYISAGNVVADLGCGPGYFTLPIAKVVGDSGRVYAVDFDPRAIERVKNKAAKYGYGSVIEAHVSSASDVDFIARDSVDLVFANGLLCCMKDHVGAVRQIARILKPEGRAYLSITKSSRKNDQRTVIKDEWRKLLLGSFEILDEGEGFASRWALLSKRSKDETHSPGRYEAGEEYRNGDAQFTGCICR